MSLQNDCIMRNQTVLEKMMTPADMKTKIPSVFDGMEKFKNVYRMLYKSPSQTSLLKSQLSRYYPHSSICSFDE